MDRFDLLSIRCKRCDWQWEMPHQNKTDDLVCFKCGSKKLDFNRNKLHMLKKGGKFIADIGFSSSRDRFGAIPFEEDENQIEEPMLIVRGNKVSISDDMTDDDLKNLLSQMNSIKSKILDEINLNQEELLKRFR